MGLFRFGKTKTDEELAKEAAPGDDADASGTRAVSDEARTRFWAMLARQDLERARKVALGYAFKRTKSRPRAR